MGEAGWIVAFHDGTCVKVRFAYPSPSALCLPWDLLAHTQETRGYLKILWRSDGGGYNADVIGVQSRPRTWAGRQRAAPPAHVRDGYQTGPGLVVGGEGARGVAGMTTNGACRRSRRRLGMSLVVGTPAAAWTVGPGSSRGCRGAGRGSRRVLIRSPRRTVHPRLPPLQYNCSTAPLSVPVTEGKRRPGRNPGGCMTFRRPVVLGTPAGCGSRPLRAV